MKELRVVHKGKTFKARALNVGAQLWLHINGETYVIDTALKRAKSSGGAAVAENSGEVLSPMPGKILKTRVKVGDKVSKGQVLIVMEAMKMEYSLSASRDGKVKSMTVKENEQVELNQLLVEISESEKI